MDLKKIIIIVLMLSHSIMLAQLEFKITTDKTEYAYSESIIIKCLVKNISNDTKYLSFGNSYSCQATFQFNDFDLRQGMGCYPAVEEISLMSNETLVYEWLVEPSRTGLPDRENVQRLIGRFSYKDIDSLEFDKVKMIDSINIIAPQFLGGQIEVYFNDSLIDEVQKVKDSLNAEVIKQLIFIEGKTYEIWRFTGISVDTVVNRYKYDERFIDLDYIRDINYNRTTKVFNRTLLLEYSLEQNYPNPFNPSTTIEYQIPANGKREMSNTKLIVYDILGREIVTLVNQQQKAGSYEVTFNASGLTSGIYFYRLQSESFVQSRKMILLR